MSIHRPPIVDDDPAHFDYDAELGDWEDALTRGSRRLRARDRRETQRRRGKTTRMRERKETSWTTNRN